MTGNCYGYCPICHDPVVSRTRGIPSQDTCAQGHRHDAGLTLTFAQLEAVQAAAVPTLQGGDAMTVTISKDDQRLLQRLLRSTEAPAEWARRQGVSLYALAARLQGVQA